MSSYSAQDPKTATIKFSLQGASRGVPCRYESMQDHRLLVQLEEALPAFLAVTVEYNDALFLGEVANCTKTLAGCQVEIRVEQVLSGLHSLIALRNRLLGDSVSPSLRRVPVKVA